MTENPVTLLDPVDGMREKLFILEATMLKMPQAPSNVRHMFAPGLYIREVTIPADTFAIGHHQKTIHMNVMVKGRVSIVQEDGSIQELKAPQVFIGSPGRKAGYIHEDMVWLNIYPTSETDIEVLEKTFLEKSPASIEDHAKMIKRLKHCDDDFYVMLDELGVSAEIVRQQSENTDDQVGFPHGIYKVKVGESSIEGKGLFATSDIKTGEIIAPARIDGKRTPAGRYTNHDKEPNAKMIVMSGDIYLVSTKDIDGCRGGRNGEEITVDYRDSLKAALESIK